MSEVSKQSGVIAVLAKRMVEERLPKALELKARIDRGETLNDLDIGFLEQVVSDANAVKPLWEKLDPGEDALEDIYPNIGNITDSDATAVGILIVMNDVRSAVDAYIDNADVTAVDPAVVAHACLDPGPPAGR